GYGRSHGVRAGAGQGSAHLNGGKVDVGQIAHRQQPIREDPEQQDRSHDQGGRNRPSYEELCVHVSALPSLFPGYLLLISTLLPGVRRSWPSVTTRCPGCSPEAITVSSPNVQPIFTGCGCAVMSGLTT